jgi:1-pyrroline-5-carboxylate dehydrogenase
MWNSKIDVPLYIGNEEELEILKQCQQHDHKHIGYVSPSQKSHIEDAIATALQAKRLGKYGLGTTRWNFF